MILTVLVGLLCVVLSNAAEEVKIEVIWKPPKCERTVKAGDFVRYHYYGVLPNGQYFDSSYERGRTYNTYVSSGWLIPGMDEALLGMCINEKRLATIPPSLAYGEEGTENIPGNSSLIFDYVLLDVWNQEDELKIIKTYIPEDCKRALVATDYIRYHYNGTLANGQPFHSSYEEDSTYNTYVGMGYLISGMDKGLLGSCIGERRTIIIPPFLAYGERGDGKNIPASATVLFDVEIIDFHNPNDTAAIKTISSKFSETGCPRKVQETDFIRYHYNGTLLDGTLFDSSYQRNHTYDTYVGLRKIIAGMEEGLLGMCVGDVREVVIPPHLGYGEEGVENIIPGSAVMKFSVYLVDVHNPKDQVDTKVLVPPSDKCTRKAQKGDYVSYVYSLELMDGNVLQDESTFSAYIGKDNLIMGIEQTLLGMCVGEKRRSVVPPHYGYGEQGEGIVAGSAVLIVTIEVTKIEESMQDGVGFLWLDEEFAKRIQFRDVDEEGDKIITLAELASFAMEQVDMKRGRFQPHSTREVAVEVFFNRLDKNEDQVITAHEFNLDNPVMEKAHNDEL